MTIEKIKTFFGRHRVKQEVYFKIPTGSSPNTLSVEPPPIGYIKIGLQENQLQYMNSDGEISPVGVAAPVSLVSSWFGGWL